MSWRLYVQNTEQCSKSSLIGRRYRSHRKFAVPKDNCLCIVYTRGDRPLCSVTFAFVHIQTHYVIRYLWNENGMTYMGIALLVRVKFQLRRDPGRCTKLHVNSIQSSSTRFNCQQVYVLWKICVTKKPLPAALGLRWASCHWLENCFCSPRLVCVKVHTHYANELQKHVIKPWRHEFCLQELVVHCS